VILSKLTGCNKVKESTLFLFGKVWNLSGLHGLKISLSTDCKGSWIGAEARRAEAEHKFQHQRGVAT
jgi:hypothetical protein